MTLLQIDQPQLLQVPVIASPFRWTKGSLTALTQMTNLLLRLVVKLLSQRREFFPEAGSSSRGQIATRLHRKTPTTSVVP
jgi:hypothetical protein